MRKLLGKRQFESYKVWNWMKSRTTCSFWCSNMSRLESLVFLWPRRVYGESCNPFWRCQSRLYNALLRGRRGTSWHSHVSANVSKIVLCGSCNTFALFLRRWVAFFVAGAALWRPPSSFCVAGEAVQMCCVACSTLHTLHFTLHTSYSNSSFKL